MRPRFSRRNGADAPAGPPPHLGPGRLHADPESLAAARPPFGNRSDHPHAGSPPIGLLLSVAASQRDDRRSHLVSDRDAPALGRKAILVWDRWRVHRSVAAHFEEHHPSWFQFEELPAYSPELNPVEPCWNHTKHGDLANFVPENLDELEIEATASLQSLREDQSFLRSAFAYCQLAL